MGDFWDRQRTVVWERKMLWPTPAWRLVLHGILDGIFGLLLLADIVYIAIYFTDNTQGSGLNWLPGAGSSLDFIIAMLLLGFLLWVIDGPWNRRNSGDPWLP